jgi:hypothetical protein
MEKTQTPRDPWKSRPTPRRKPARRLRSSTRLSRRALLKLAPLATFVALSEPAEPDERGTG